MYLEVDPRAALYLIFPAGLLLFYWRYFNQSFYILGVTLFVKVVYGFVLLFFVINRWNFGDLPTYYILANVMTEENFQFHVGSLATAQLHSYLFIIFGTSLYGLALVSACIAHLSFTIMAFSIYSRCEYRKFNNAILLINLLPLISMQSTYIGREPWILLITGISMYLLNNDIINKIPLALFLLFVLVTRPYHGLVLFASLGLTILFTYGILNLKVFVLLIFSSPIIIYSVSKVKSYLNFVLDLGLSGFLSDSYYGGNQLLEPYAFPLTPLQLFRPFPWEANEVFLLLASLENMVILLMLMRVSFNLLNNRLNIFKYSPSLIFMFIFTLIYGSLFMFSENIGDLSRRHVYFYPFIIFTYFKIYKPFFRFRFGSKAFV